MMKSLLKSALGPKRWGALKRTLQTWQHRNDLTALARVFSCDKADSHNYTPHYMRQLDRFRRRRFNLLEIGVGGHEAPDVGGASLRMWKTYFAGAEVFAIDYFDKSAIQEPRITIFKGSQNDPEFLRSVASQIGRLHVIVDDGSHINEHVLTSFRTLFPLLEEDGIYVIEDTHTAYDERFGGTEEAHAESTSIGLVKTLIDGLHWQEFLKTAPPEIGRQVVAVHCYHNLVFIEKGRNDEKSHNDREHRIHSGT